MRLLTFECLYDYFVNNGASFKFSSQNDGDRIVVQVPGSFKYDKFAKDTEGLLPVVLQSCHIGTNCNHSDIKEEVMISALPSFSNRPILGYIHDVDGQPEFYGHNMHLDENGITVYDEVPVGIIPESCEATLEYDEDKGKTYVVVKGYIFEEYSKAAEILRREEECSVSVELSIRELSYDAKEKVLSIDDFFFSGVTILGKDDDGKEVKPGMAGANIKLEDFSEKNNSVFYNENTKLIELLERLNDTISNFNINQNSKEGGTLVSKFEELLNKYNKTSEEIDFEYESMTDEELEAKFEELFGETNTEGEGNVDPEPTSCENDEFEEDNDEITLEAEEDPIVEIEQNNKYSVTFPSGEIREFELSFDEVINALYSLVNNTYGEQDNCWYSVTVYEEHLIMVDWWTGKAYKQTYRREDDSFSLVGDRVEVFSNWLTADEESALKELRSNYSIIEEQLKTYQVAEENANKDALFVSGEYSSIVEFEEVKALVGNHSEFSYDELKSKLDAIMLTHAKAGDLKFSVEEPQENKPVSKVGLPIVTSAKKSRYGSLKFN